MKVAIVLSMFFAPIIAIAQTPIIFTEVVKVDSNITKDELYKRARLWYADAFKNSKEVLQISDKESGELVGKALFSYYSNYFTGSGATIGSVKYTIKIYVKNGRYKYEITDFVHEAYRTNERPKNIGLIMSDTFVHLGFIGGKSIDKKIWNELKEDCDEEARVLISNLKEYMNKPTASSSNDW